MSSSPPSSSPRVARKRARARAEILVAAEALVRESGLDKLTIEAIAARADVSKPAVYYYFASKEAVALALGTARHAEEVLALRAAVEATPEGESVVAAVARAFVEHHRNSMHMFRAEYVVGQVLGFDQQAIDDQVNPSMVELFGLIEARLQSDRRRGLLHEGLHLRRTAVAAWMAAHGLVATLSLLDSGHSKLLHDVDDMLDELCGLLTRGVYRDASSAARQNARSRPGKKKVVQERRTEARR